MQTKNPGNVRLSPDDDLVRGLHINKGKTRPIARTSLQNRSGSLTNFILIPRNKDGGKYPILYTANLLDIYAN